MPLVIPGGTVRHWVTGRCAAAEESTRKEMWQGAKRIMKLVQAAVRDEDNETYKTCKRAEEAAGRAAKGMTVNEQEWEALAQVMSAQLPMDATGETKKRLEKREGEIDGERRGMVRAAEQQITQPQRKGGYG